MDLYIYLRVCYESACDAGDGSRSNFLYIVRKESIPMA